MAKKVLLAELGEHVCKSADILIGCTSFESRSLSVVSALAECNELTALFYYVGNSCEIAKANLDKLYELRGQIELSAFELNPDRPHLAADTIIDSLLSAIEPFDTPPNIVVDITTFTREHLLIVIRLLHKFRNDIGNVTWIYTPAAAMSDSWLSRGIKSYRSILGYLGEMSPILPSHLIVMTGFELDRARNTIDKYESEKLTIGVGAKAGSIRPDFYERNELFAKELEVIYGDEFDRLEFSLIDPVDTKNNLKKYIDENAHGENIIIAPLNNKISTLGAGLLAIEDQRIQLCYSQAELYNSVGYSSQADYCYFDRIIWPE